MAKPYFAEQFRFTSFLTVLLIATQLSSCGAENLLSAVAPEIGSGPNGKPRSAAIISGIYTGSIIEDVDPDGDNLLEVGGKLEIIDNDAGEDSFIARRIDGDYGNLVIDQTGNWNYSADNRQPAIQNLAGNAKLMDNLPISSVDGTTLTVAITIIGVADSDNGSNTSAIISGDISGSLTEDNNPDSNGFLISSGALSITDIDAGESSFIATTYNGNYGLLEIDTGGNWRYSANNNQNAIQSLNTGDSVSDSLTVSSLDGTTQTITMTIFGVDEANIPAIISGQDSANLTEDIDPDNDNLLEASGQLTITDSNAGEAAFVSATIIGNYGTLTINTSGFWNYAANNNQSVIQNLNAGASLFDNLIVSSLDGTTHAIVITIAGVNENNPPPATINLSWTAPAEREDNAPISLAEISAYKIYFGTSQGQYTSNITVSDGSATDYTFQNLASGTYYFVITTIDSEGRESQFSTEVNYTI